MIRTALKTSLFRRIMFSIVLASVSFLTLLTLVVHYAGDALESALLDTQLRSETEHIRELLAQDPTARLPDSSSLTAYLGSRRSTRPIPDYLGNLDPGARRDLHLDGRIFHLLAAPLPDDIVYLQYDITDIERSEDMLTIVTTVAWAVMLVVIVVIARILSRQLSEPVAQLSRELSQIDPDRRGVRLGERFAEDEIGLIARAFDSYTARMDDYVEKQMAFAAMASHELRSPLTIVQTSAELIASRHEDPDLLAQLDKIRRASLGMANMIHALLAVTRDRHPERDPQEVPLRPLVDEIVESLEPEIHAKQITIDNRLDPARSLHCDPTLLTVLLTNLIRNGVKHGDHSRIVIDLQDTVLSIADDGIGIDPESLQRIFDFGFRGQNSLGYGIGLYISRLVCEYQGWKLSLQPNPGGGIVAQIDFGS